MTTGRRGKTTRQKPHSPRYPLFRHLARTWIVAGALSIPVFLRMDPDAHAKARGTIEGGFTWTSGALAPEWLGWLNPLGAALLTDHDFPSPAELGFGGSGLAEPSGGGDLYGAVVFLLVGWVYWFFVLGNMGTLVRIRRKPGRKWTPVAGTILFVLLYALCCVPFALSALSRRLQRLERTVVQLSAWSPPRVDYPEDADAPTSAPIVRDYAAVPEARYDWRLFFHDPHREALRWTSRPESLEMARKAAGIEGNKAGIAEDDIRRLIAVAEEFHTDLARHESPRVLAPVRFERYRIHGRMVWVCGWAWEIARIPDEAWRLIHVEIFVIDARTWKVIGWITCL